MCASCLLDRVELHSPVASVACFNWRRCTRVFDHNLGLGKGSVLVGIFLLRERRSLVRVRW